MDHTPPTYSPWLEALRTDLEPVRAALDGADQEPDCAEHAMWEAKRAAQARDLDAVASGRLAPSDLSWLKDGRARDAVIKESPL